MTNGRYECQLLSCGRTFDDYEQFRVHQHSAGLVLPLRYGAKPLPPHDIIVYDDRGATVCRWNMDDAVMEGQRGHILAVAMLIVRAINEVAARDALPVPISTQTAKPTDSTLGGETECPECGSVAPAPYMQGDRIDHYCDNSWHDESAPQTGGVVGTSPSNKSSIPTLSPNGVRTEMSLNGDTPSHRPSSLQQ